MCYWVFLSEIVWLFDLKFHLRVLGYSSEEILSCGYNRIPMNIVIYHLIASYCSQRQHLNFPLVKSLWKRKKRRK